MRSAIYFPILRAKRGELIGLGHLSPLARTWIRPLLDIPKLPAKRKDPIEYYLSDLATAERKRESRP